MAVAASSFEGLLRELAPAFAEAFRPGPLMQMMEQEMAERKRKDDEWLASLGVGERQSVLIQRRIKRLESRFRAALDFRHETY